MSDAHLELETAVLDALRADAGVQAVLGNPARVFSAHDARAIYPHLEIARHSSVPTHASASPASDHRLDLAVVSTLGGRAEVSRAFAAVEDALVHAQVSMPSFHCVLLVPLFRDVMRQTPSVWRGVMRWRAVTEPL